jgi:hypothetical protein
MKYIKILLGVIFIVSFSNIAFAEGGEIAGVFDFGSIEKSVKNDAEEIEKEEVEAKEAIERAEVEGKLTTVDSNIKKTKVELLNLHKSLNDYYKEKISLFQESLALNVDFLSKVQPSVREEILTKLDKAIDQIKKHSSSDYEAQSLQAEALVKSLSRIIKRNDNFMDKVEARFGQAAGLAVLKEQLQDHPQTQALVEHDLGLLNTAVEDHEFVIAENLVYEVCDSLFGLEEGTFMFEDFYKLTSKQKIKFEKNLLKLLKEHNKK